MARFWWQTGMVGLVRSCQQKFPRFWQPAGQPLRTQELLFEWLDHLISWKRETWVHSQNSSLFMQEVYGTLWYRINWKGCTIVPSLFLDRLSRSCITFEAVRCWKRCEAFSEIQYITEVRGAGAPLVQEKVIDSITALSYILPHLFKAPFQFPQIHFDIVD